jgi:hypothetical protein
MVNAINYRILKSNIVHSCKQVGEGIEFEVDFDKLTEETSEIGLIPIKIGLRSNKITSDIIPYLSEYFEKDHLAWITDDKNYTILAFVVSSSLDEETLEKIKSYNSIDSLSVSIVSKILSSYPCYYATVVSYKSNTPKRIGRPSYEIICRANKVVIKNKERKEETIEA